ncbi:MAG: hypothetical protein ABIA63_15430, partial [bacterium]
MNKNVLISSVAFIFIFLLGMANPEKQDFYIMEGALDITSEPLLKHDILMPEKFRKTLEHYKNKKYRLAILELKKFVEIGLPDERLDIYYFMMGECYNQLELDRFSQNFYSHFTDEFLKSHYRPYALFRQQEYNYQIKKYGKSESVYKKILAEYPNHSLIPAVTYNYCKQLFLDKDYDEAFSLAIKIGNNSPYFLPATYFKGLCCAEQKNYQKAILFFDFIVKENKKDVMFYEAKNMLGNVYYRLKRYPVALKIFSEIPKNCPQHYNAMLKTCKIFLATGKPSQAVTVAETMLGREYQSEYVFEIIFLLGDGYIQIGAMDKAQKLQEFMAGYMQKSQINFKIFQEKTKLSIIRKQWDDLFLKEIEKNGKNNSTDS